MSIIKNTRSIIKTVANTAVDTVSVAVELTAGAAQLINKGVRATPATLKEVGKSPVYAAAEYRAVTNKTSYEEELDKLLSTKLSVEESSRAVGRLWAAMLEEDEDTK